MKRLQGWDAYVKEALSDQDRSLEFPLSEDEVYVIKYPTRRQGKKIFAAQQSGDVDEMIITLLGEELGRRVIEMSDDHPALVVEAFLLDIMRKFGFAPGGKEEGSSDSDEPDPPSSPSPIA